MIWNPIWIKELKIRARTAKIPILLMFYNAVVALIALLMMLASVDVQGTGSYVDYSGITSLFAGLSVMQCCVGILVTLVMTANAISGEWERGTMDLILATPVSTFTFLSGKMMAAITASLVFVASSLPVLAISSVYGGINIKDIGYLFGLFLVLLIYTGSGGILCSSLTKRSSLAIVSSLLFEIVLYIGPFAVLEGIYTFFYNHAQGGSELFVSLNGWVFLLVFSPIILMMGYYDRIMGGSELADLFLYNYGISADTKLFLFLQNHFVTCCVLIQLLLSGTFFWIAVRKLEIYPKRKKVGKRRNIFRKWNGKAQKCVIK
jgi:ABC-type transport system involved in multi-copper enzyme maturation permease subunit